MSTSKLILDLTATGELRRRRSSEGLPVMLSEVYLQDIDKNAYADVLFARNAESLKDVQVSIVEPRDRGILHASRRRSQTSNLAF